MLTNNVTNMFFPLYRLRGEEYRSPMAIVHGYDDVRTIGAGHYVSVHGDPFSGRAEIKACLTLHCDACALACNQAVRGLNQDWSPDGIVQRTQLPQRFLDEPMLNQVYSVRSCVARCLSRVDQLVWGGYRRVQSAKCCTAWQGHRQRLWWHGSACRNVTRRAGARRKN